jgi:hypothetical protein
MGKIAVLVLKIPGVIDYSIKNVKAAAHVHLLSVGDGVQSLILNSSLTIYL